ncbi:MAG: DegT/DnrJ/EryC1/StrS aminotransferase family protein [Opitutales bacterium]|nr:DegT/DnrJ/EryC1/StrS aminotransferase family protein [Opitutales bacterium]
MFESFAKWPHFGGADIEAVAEVLRSGKINRWTGAKNAEFEKKICENANAKYAVALANGSVALECALRALGVGAGDEVITSCRTFVASASCAAMCGAKPVVADVDLNTQNITAESVEKCISPRTRAIVAVHHAGVPCDMDSITALAKSRNIFVVEDCAQAHGAVYKGRPVGSIGDIAAWSFCQDKIITTGGEGGAVSTNSEALWRKVWEFKDHGKSFDAVFSPIKTAGFKWLVESFGTNLRMTEMQAALGVRGYENLPKWLELRRRNAKIYEDALSEFECVRLQKIPQDIEPSFYKYYCFVRPEKLKGGWDRDRIAAEISARGVPCFSGTCWNVSAEKAFVRAGLEKTKEQLPNAYELKNSAMMFLTHPTLELSDLHAACGAIKNVLAQAQK